MGKKAAAPAKGKSDAPEPTEKKEPAREAESPLVRLLGPLISKNNGESEAMSEYKEAEKTDKALKGRQYIGLLFAQYNHSASEQFSDKLAKAYREYLYAKGLEVVFISCDMQVDYGLQQFARQVDALSSVKVASDAETSDYWWTLAKDVTFEKRMEILGKYMDPKEQGEEQGEDRSAPKSIFTARVDVEGTSWRSPNRHPVAEGSIKYVKFSLLHDASATLGLCSSLVPTGPQITDANYDRIYEISIRKYKTDITATIFRGDASIAEGSARLTTADYLDTPLWVCVDSDTGQVAVGSGPTISQNTIVEFMGDKGLDPVDVVVKADGDSGAAHFGFEARTDEPTMLELKSKSEDEYGTYVHCPEGWNPDIYRKKEDVDAGNFSGLFVYWIPQEEGAGAWCKASGERPGGLTSADAYSDEAVEHQFISVAVPTEYKYRDFGGPGKLVLPVTGMEFVMEDEGEGEECPKLVIIDPKGNVVTRDGVFEVSTDPTGEEFPWAAPRDLTEDDILLKMGLVTPPVGEAGIKGVFIRSNQYVGYGFTDQEDEDEDVPFSGMNLRPYVVLSRAQILADVKRQGFANDFHPIAKDVEKLQVDTLLLLYDPEKTHGERVCWCMTAQAYEREWERITELRSRYSENQSPSWLRRLEASAPKEETLEKMEKTLLGKKRETIFQSVATKLQVKNTLGSFDQKASESLGAVVSQSRVKRKANKYVHFVEEIWKSKAGSVVDELLANSFMEVNEKPLDRALLTRLCVDFAKRYGSVFTDERLKASPLGIVSLILYTMQDVDIDRMYLFADVPEIPEGEEDPENRDRHYLPYRQKHEGDMRNAMMFGDACWSVRSCWDAFSGGFENAEAEQKLRKWVKWATLVGALRQKLSLGKPVTRGVTQLPDSILEDLMRKQPDDLIFWAALSSTTMDASISDNYANQRKPCNRNVVFTIHDVDEGIPLHQISQYPVEQEILLPCFSMLRVREVIPSASEDKPHRINCEYAGCLMPQGLQELAEKDLSRSMARLWEEVCGADDADDGVVVRDLPWDCKDWISDTMEETHADVGKFTVQNSRALMRVMITRPRAHFGKTHKFSDSGENIQYCRPQKDPNYTSQPRKELEMGIQAVKETCTQSCQTAWFRPVNKSTQYSPKDFLPNGDAELGYDKVSELTEFLEKVSVRVEESLQTNETVDIFQEEFAHLGEEEAGAVSKTHSNIKDLRTFYDVNYTKGKRIECVEWVPNSSDMLACSCCENLTFNERLENMGKATMSTVLLWSQQETLSPHCVLLAPWDVSVFKFYPSNGKYLVGGLANGQITVWKLSDADLGYASRDSKKGAGSATGNGIGASTAGVEEKSGAMPTVPYKQLSIIDESHRKAVLAIEWLPATLELERRGRSASEKNPKDGPVKYFLTIAGDGQLMIWDFQTLYDSINDNDFTWRPLHRVQLNRQDSGTEMGCCHLLYCQDRYDEKGAKLLTNWYASTEEGELIFGDWAARHEEDRKPECCKKMFTVSKTYRPMLSLEQSPFFPDILLGVTDWAFYIWKDGIQEHLFQSTYTSTYFARGLWSPTRPSVIFLGLVSGGIDIWDFSDQSHKASLTDTGASVEISSMAFLKQPESSHSSSEQLLAVGDAQGYLHVLTIPKNLVRPAGRELENMKKFLEREEARVSYFHRRQEELQTLKEKMEKQAQMAADSEAVDKGKLATDEAKEDEKLEAEYLKLQEECVEALRTGIF